MALALTTVLGKIPAAESISRTIACEQCIRLLERGISGAKMDLSLDVVVVPNKVASRISLPAPLVVHFLQTERIYNFGQSTTKSLQSHLAAYTDSGPEEKGAPSGPIILLKGCPRPVALLDPTLRAELFGESPVTRVPMDSVRIGTYKRPLGDAHALDKGISRRFAVAAVAIHGWRQT